MMQFNRHRTKRHVYTLMKVTAKHSTSVTVSCLASISKRRLRPQRFLVMAESALLCTQHPGMSAKQRAPSLVLLLIRELLPAIFNVT